MSARRGPHTFDASLAAIGLFGLNHPPITGRRHRQLKRELAEGKSVPEWVRLIVTCPETPASEVEALRAPGANVAKSERGDTSASAAG